jgi:hypothetical protein
MEGEKKINKSRNRISQAKTTFVIIFHNSKWRNKNSRVTKTVSDGAGVVCVGGGDKNA